MHEGGLRKTFMETKGLRSTPLKPLHPLKPYCEASTLGSLPLSLLSKPPPLPFEPFEASCISCHAFWNLQYTIHCLLFSPHTMSLYFEMKMIRPKECSGSHCVPVIMFCISAKMCNAVNPEDISTRRSLLVRGPSGSCCFVDFVVFLRCICLCSILTVLLVVLSIHCDCACFLYESKAILN